MSIWVSPLFLVYPAFTFLKLDIATQCALSTIELGFLRVQACAFAKAERVREHSWFAYISQFLL